MISSPKFENNCRRSRTEPLALPRPPAALASVAHRHGERLALPDKHDQLLAPRHAHVEEVARQHGVVLCHDRDHRCRVLGALRLVNRKALSVDLPSLADSVRRLKLAHAGGTHAR